MKILFLSREGDGISLARRLKEEGNAVRLFCQHNQGAGQGLVDRIDSWRPSIPWADLVVADGVGWGEAYEDTLRKLGKPLFGVSKLADMFSLDRWRTYDVFSRAGVAVPRRWEVREETSDVLNQWVSGVTARCMGETFVCREPEDFLDIRELVPEGVGLEVTDLLEGVEVRTTGWFNGRGWMEPFYHGLMDMEELSGGMGQVGECGGGVVVRSGGDRVVEQVLMPLTEMLSRMSYRGPLSVTSFVGPEGLTVLRACAGICYDEIEAVMEGSRDSLSDLLFETAQGVRKSIDVSSDVMAVVRVNSWRSIRATLSGLSEAGMKHMWLNQVYQEGGQIRAAGMRGVFKATAVGRDVREAVKRALRTAREVHFIGKLYRTDVGQRALADLAILKEGGWISA